MRSQNYLYFLFKTFRPDCHDLSGRTLGYQWHFVDGRAVGVLTKVQCLLKAQFSKYALAHHVSRKYNELGSVPFLQGDCPFPEARAQMSQQLSLTSSEQGK